MKPIYEVVNSNPDEVKRYECDEYIVYAYPETCFFCEHCTDIFFDYTNGPYWLICDLFLEKNTAPVIRNEIRCKDFVDGGW